MGPMGTTRCGARWLARICPGLMALGLWMASGSAFAGASDTTTSSTASTTATTSASSTTTSSSQLTITTTSLPGGVIGRAYTARLHAKGGTPPYKWAVGSGHLPPGLSLDSSSGEISGVPTTSGSESVTFLVTDSADPPDTTGLSMTVKISSSAPTTTPETIPPPASNGGGGGGSSGGSACGSALDQEIGRKLAYQPSQTMHVGEPTAVVVVLGTGSLPPVTLPGNTIVVPIVTTCEVEAQLVAAPGTFDISPPGEQPTSFLDASTVTWTWQVTPERAGRGLQLELEVNSLFQEAGASIPGSVRSYTASIDVTASPVSLGKRASSIFNAPVFDTLVGALIPIGLAAAGTYWHRRRKATKAAASPPSDGSAPPQQPPAQDASEGLPDARR